MQNLDEIEDMHKEDIQQLVQEFLPGVMFIEHGSYPYHARRVERGIEAMQQHDIEKELKRFVSSFCVHVRAVALFPTFLPSFVFP